MAQTNTAQPGMHSHHSSFVKSNHFWFRGVASCPSQFQALSQRSHSFICAKEQFLGAHQVMGSVPGLLLCLALKTKWEQSSLTAQPGLCSHAEISVNSPECVLPLGTGNWVTRSFNHCKFCFLMVACKCGTEKKKDASEHRAKPDLCARIGIVWG